MFYQNAIEEIKLIYRPPISVRKNDILLKYSSLMYALF